MSAPQLPQHDEDGRSATILPGVPLPDWALPAGPIEPEAEVLADTEADGERIPEPELVTVGVLADPVAVGASDAAASEPAYSALAAPVPQLEPARPDAAPLGPPLSFLDLPEAPPEQADDAAAPPAPVPATPFAAPLALTPHGPGPLRAGWGFPAGDPVEPIPGDETGSEAAAEAPADIDAGTTEPGRDEEVEPVVSDAAEDPVVAEAILEVSLQSEAVEDEQRSRRGLLIIAGVGIAAVLAVVAAFVWPGFLLTPESPAPTAITPVVAAPAAAVTVTTPAAIGGLAKLTGAPADALAKAADATGLIGLSAPVSAVYGTAGTPTATVVAWRATEPLSGAAVGQALAGFKAATGTAVSVVATPAIAGGRMTCGATQVSGVPATVCFFGQNDILGSITVLRPASPAAGVTTATAIHDAVTTTT